MTTFKFYIHARSPQDLLDLFMVGTGAPLDGRTAKLSYMRVPNETVVECLFRDADAANALEDYIAENEFSLPGLRIIDETEFTTLQAEAVRRASVVTVQPPSRVTVATPVSIDPSSFAGCGDASYRVPRKRPDAE